jgi:hypothetical protein
MTGDLYYCDACDLVYLDEDTDAYYATGFPTLTSARGCPVDGSRLSLVGDADLSIVDYLAVRG